MSRTYTLAKKGNPLDNGISDSYWLEIKAVGKRSSISRLMVANEYISARLGTFLGLPIPPFALLQEGNSRSGPVWFASLDYGLAGEALPDVDPEEVGTEMPEVAAGVLLFDVWIGNADRHEGNLSLEKPTGKAPMLNVFDHANAILGIEGTQRLASIRDAFVINSPYLRHCLLGVLDRDEHLLDWVLKIQAAPDFLIDDACNDTVKVGLLNDVEAIAASGFLKHRRDQIRNLIIRNKSEFTNLQCWCLDFGNPSAS